MCVYADELERAKRHAGISNTFREFSLSPQHRSGRTLVYTGDMNKRVILLFAMVFSFIGGYVPVLLGDSELFGGWTILAGLAGGLFGIWLGVVVSKRWG